MLKNFDKNKDKPKIKRRTKTLLPAQALCVDRRKANSNCPSAEALLLFFCRSFARPSVRFIVDTQTQIKESSSSTNPIIYEHFAVPYNVTPTNYLWNVSCTHTSCDKWPPFSIALGPGDINPTRTAEKARRVKPQYNTPNHTVQHGFNSIAACMLVARLRIASQGTTPLFLSRWYVVSTAHQQPGSKGTSRHTSSTNIDLEERERERPITATVQHEKHRLDVPRLKHHITQRRAKLHLVHETGRRRRHRLLPSQLPFQTFVQVLPRHRARHTTALFGQASLPALGVARHSLTRRLARPSAATTIDDSSA